MGLETIYSKSEVVACQRQFATEVKREARRVGKRRISFRPATVEQAVFWLEPEGVWASFSGQSGDLNHFWNPFGTENPSNPKRALRITIEINPPIEGIDRRTGGAFARDSASGATYLIHRGMMGGGKPGVGKTAFLAEYRGALNLLSDEGFGESEVVVIGELGSPDLVSRVADFVKEVERVKGVLDGSNLSLHPGLFVKGAAKIYVPEKEGALVFSTRSAIRAELRHATVTNSLEAVLREHGQVHNRHVPRGGKPDIVYTPEDRRKKRVLFEVKTDSSLTSVCATIGQLLYYSTSFRKKPALVAVFPEDISGAKKEILRELDIQVMVYSRHGNDVGFKRIARFY